MQCKKIPELICLDTYNGNYFEYEAAVYSQYEETYENKKFYYNGKPIYQKKIPLFKQKSCTFWHIISSGNKEDNRTPDLRRYERIRWPGFILEHCISKCNNILVWENKRGGKTRTLLWCKDINYLVVLDKRKGYYLFWTAYPLTYKNMERKLQKEYEEYSKKDAKTAY